MVVNPNLLGYVQKMVNSKSSMELNLVRGEADMMDFWKKEELKNLNEELGYKIKPTEFVVVNKLGKVLKTLGGNWEDLLKNQKDLFANLVLREPENELLKKSPVANVLYKKMEADGFWEKADEMAQRNAIEQILGLAHLANDAANELNLQNALNSDEINAIDQVKKIAQMGDALKKANLMRNEKGLVPMGQVQDDSPQEDENQNMAVQPAANIAPNTADLEKIRIKTMIEGKEKIDFSARSQLNPEVKVHWGGKKNKTKNEKLREAYAEAEKQAQEHLKETLEKEEKNLKEQYKEQKRFKKQSVTQKVKKDRKGWYA